MRTQIRQLVALARARRVGSGTAWDDAGLQRTVGRLDAHVDALWRMTQMCISEAEHTDAPSPLGSAVKLHYSELTQEISELAMSVIGAPIVGNADLDGVPTSDAVTRYLASLQFTIAAGTSQIQRNLIAERILGMPKGA
jgi:alkylation response protein AidB-like acyl-CoA dehydrogenase